MTREEILNKAKECVCGDRNEQYGEPEDCFNLICKYWGVYLAQKRTPLELCGEDVAAMMVLLKVARNQYKSKDDNWVDMAGYAACGAEVSEKIKKAEEDIPAICVFCYEVFEKDFEASEYGNELCPKCRRMVKESEPNFDLSKFIK